MSECKWNNSIEDIKCNKCGLSCKLLDYDKAEKINAQTAIDNHGLVKAEVYGGYDSTPGNGFGALDDSSRYTFSLCEFCLDWLFQQFKIPVKEEDYTTGIVEEWKSAIDRIVRDSWRNNNPGYFIEESKKRNT